MTYLKILLASLFLYLSASGQTEIQLVLKNPENHHIDKVDAFDLSQVEIYKYKFKDTLLLRFKKNNIDCYNIRYHENGKMYRQQIWLDPGKITIKAHIDGDNLVIDTVLNSPFYYQVADFNEAYRSFLTTRDSTGMNTFLLNSFEENSNNPFSMNVGLYFLTLNQNKKDQLQKLRTLIDGQAGRFNWFLLFPMVSGRLDKLLTVNRIDFAKFSFINEYKRKTAIKLDGAEFYVIDCWFLACMPCIAQHKEIKENLDKLRSRKVEVIGVSTDRDWKKWKTYLTDHNYTWANFTEDKSLAFTKELSIAAFPTYLILNKDGEILESFNSFKEVLMRFQIVE
ncbi:MAG TPA: TlpA disulfide reductase family protein [Chitinophagaceae bacterium]|nr:TlpA disulfide reductase family protein [Chitinophagaceae bacterium]HPN60260.1 TlpA disulfide reductase family protein [Chitinophagaceae bacterium]HRG25294.1 TlpA disulfide reductase family protein [Chitinophagaceae bacterium]